MDLHGTGVERRSDPNNPRQRSLPVCSGRGVRIPKLTESSPP
jgi:hypothetical protein